MRKTGSRRIRLLFVLAPVFAGIVAVAACSSSIPEDTGASGGSSVPTGTGSCATPNDGCYCATPGEVVPCGQVERKTDAGYVECMMGHRTCEGTSWGTCVGDRDVIVDPNDTSTVGKQSTIGPGGACGTDAGGPANPCDPYCNGIVDSPALIGLACGDGGSTIGFVDGGLALCPTASAEAGASTSAATSLGGAPPTVDTTATGDSTCGSTTNNLHGGACTTANQFTACQQDFRCDPTTLTCQWNGPNNYYDGNAGGADITIGAGCNDGTSDHLPVCNRGSTSVAAGNTITVDLVTTAQYTSWNTGSCPALAGPPTCSKMLTAALDPGTCVDVTGCTLTGDHVAIVNAEASAIPEATGRCANNAAKARTDGTSCATCELCDTKLSGTVFDPSGPSGNNLPLAGVSVFVPAATPPVFTDGVQCDTCSSIEGPYLVKAVSDYKGNFAIEGVPPGTAVPVVVQSGRWRRIEQLNIPACSTNTPASGTFRLPQSHTDGLGGHADIPKTAILTESQESIECLFAKIGVATSEITSASASPAGRIQLFKDKGMSAPTATPAASSLYASQAAINAYTAAFFPCAARQESTESITTTQSGYLATFASLGGHTLYNHHGADGPFYSAGKSALLASSGTFVASSGVTPYKFLVDVGSTPQQQLYDWLNYNGGMATYGAPLLNGTEGASQVTAAAAMTTTWLSGLTSNLWNAGYTNSNFVGSYSFEMGNIGGVPTIGADCGAADGHGRVYYNGMHVSPTRGNSSGTFPGACDVTTSLNEMEKALEFHIFQLTACQLGGSPPPPPPPALQAFTITRDFVAQCDPGYRVRWAPFYWQDIIPGNAEIMFQAATAETQALLDMLPIEAPAPGPPLSAPIGTATVTALPPTWDCSGCPSNPVTVDSQLELVTGTPSKPYLRVYMKLIPNTPLLTLSPTLLAWRQQYDCVPSE